jgi:hypothetical protein
MFNYDSRTAQSTPAGKFDTDSSTITFPPPPKKTTFSTNPNSAYILATRAETRTGTYDEVTNTADL